MKKLALTSLAVAAAAACFSTSSDASARPFLFTYIDDKSPCDVADFDAAFGARQGVPGCGICHSGMGAMFRMNWLSMTDWENPTANGGNPLTDEIWAAIDAMVIDFDNDGISDAAELDAGWNPWVAYDANNEAESKICDGALAWPGAMPEPMPTMTMEPVMPMPTMTMEPAMPMPTMTADPVPLDPAPTMAPVEPAPVTPPAPPPVAMPMPTAVPVVAPTTPDPTLNPNGGVEGGADEGCTCAVPGESKQNNPWALGGLLGLLGLSLVRRRRK